LKSVSIYFFAGDFADVLKRYDSGVQQIYQTHNEVAKLIRDLAAANHKVNIYSFVTKEKCEEFPIEGTRIISLGAKNYAAGPLLSEAVKRDRSDKIVAHFANLDLLRAVAAKSSNAMAVLANSYNNSGIRPWLAKRKIVSLLNSPRFELVSNHCLPATEHLAKIGVKREKLIAWDIPHPYLPASSKQKELVARKQFTAVYVGSITESKGVSDMIRAIALLRKQGMEVRCSLAGLGDIQEMQAIGDGLGISDLLEFLHLIGNIDVFNLMVKSDIVIVPSRTGYPEGFPLTMFEAIASRTPIVCSDHPMFRTVLLDGRNAAVFPAGDADALAAAISRILTDRSLYGSLSCNAISTWEALKGPADWRTMLLKWITEGASSLWLRKHMLRAGSPQTSGALD
jgi:glycosyltransferase involved in cell wall biosynthesis